VTVLRYSLLRILLFSGCLLILWLIGLRDPTWLMLGTAVTSVTLSFFLLRAPREQLAHRLAERVSGRLPGDPGDAGERLPGDAGAEDAEVDGPGQPA
jgi:hypothetical protein